MNVTIKISVNKISIRETCSTFWKLCLRGRRIVTFLIIAPYKYSYLLTYLLTEVYSFLQTTTNTTNGQYYLRYAVAARLVIHIS